LAHKALAFVDMEIPLGSAPNQVMLAPRVQARLLQDLAVRATDKVLDIGTGSGFMAALLGHQAASVLSLELDPDLAAQAQANLHRAGVSNVTVRQADGSQGAAADGPFDAILLSGSVAEVPAVLLQQLSVGGRLVAPMHRSGGRGQVLVVIDRRESGLVRTEHDFAHSVYPVLEAIEEQVTLLKLFTEMKLDASDVQARIGRENEGALSEAAVLASSYQSGHQQTATLGVVGPTRMDYSSNMTAVRAVARYLSRLLGDDNQERN
jgi:protein-L-isoaspartate(D-aspartate) O-methyltransferase